MTAAQAAERQAFFWGVQACHTRGVVPTLMSMARTGLAKFPGKEKWMGSCCVLTEELQRYMLG